MKSFLSGRGVYQQYYAIRSLENRQSKFTITAPFDGTVSMGNANQGTVLRAGQKVGEFMRDGAYELEAAISVADAEGIEVGDPVLLQTPNGHVKVQGKIIRIASNVDPSNQRITLFAGVQHPQLKEGMYLDGVIQVASVSNAFAINRNLLLPGNQVFVVRDTVLAMQEVRVIDRYEEEALVTGLNEGDVLLNQVIEGAYEGMLVKSEQH